MTDKRRTTRSTTMTTSLLDSYTILFESYKSHSKQTTNRLVCTVKEIPLQTWSGVNHMKCAQIKNKQFCLSIFSPIFTCIDIGIRLHRNLLNGINSEKSMDSPSWKNSISLSLFEPPYFSLSLSLKPHWRENPKNHHRPLRMRYPSSWWDCDRHQFPIGPLPHNPHSVA